MNKRNLVSCLFASAVLFSGGCLAPKGLLYTKIREPLTLPVERTGAPRASKKCYVSLTRLKEPVTRINLSVMWSHNIIKEEAEKAGMREIYYSDLETLSIFLDCYVRRRIVFYGD